MLNKSKLKKLRKLKTAIVYDKLAAEYGGAEQVLIALHQLFPKAPIYTSVYDQKKAIWAKVFPKIKTSFLQKFPGAKGGYRWYLPLMPLAFESLDLTNFDLVISVTSGEAKGVITQPNQLHLCYLLTPPRYLYSHRQQYLQSKKVLQLPIFKTLANKTLNYLTWWDQAAVHRPDLIIPISKLVAKRVEEYYQLKAGPIVYPPIDVVLNKPAGLKPADMKLSPSLPQKFLLVVSRLVAYKQINLAIQASLALNRNLIIVGTGPEKTRLQSLAGKLKTETNSTGSVVFLGNQEQSVVNQLYQHAQALLMPAQEDFGISALQANYWGTPVILHQQSGAAEIIKHKKHGLHLPQANLSYLIRAINQLKNIQFVSKDLKSNTQTCTIEQFLGNLESIISKNIN